MSKFVVGTVAALALGLGLSLVAASAVNAQQSAGGAQVTVEGAQIQTRARGRGPVVLHRGGGPRYYGGPRYRSGRYVAGGIAAGIAGAIILNEVARPRYYYDGPVMSCGELEARCDSGQDWACRRLDNDPRC